VPFVAAPCFRTTVTDAGIETPASTSTSTVPATVVVAVAAWFGGVVTVIAAALPLARYSR